jgi:hypothetical protein
MNNQLTPYALWLDDLRPLPEDATDEWKVAVSSAEAIELTHLYGPPSVMSLDHDLSGDDTSMVYLKWLAENHFDCMFSFRVHSANPVGKKNIQSYIDSWHRSREL